MEGCLVECFRNRMVRGKMKAQRERGDGENLTTMREMRAMVMMRVKKKDDLWERRGAMLWE